MNRIDQRFAGLRGSHRTALIPFVTAGDPLASVEAGVGLLHALVAAGADVIELGMPFSDPMADGPVIQRANERALARHVGLAHVLAVVRGFRTRDAQTPLVLMGYLNPIEIRGVEHFAAEASSAGVDALLLVDAPQDDERLAVTLAAHGLHLIRLVAPTTEPARMDALARQAQGFLYFVSITGTTGAAAADAGAIAAQVGALRERSAVPVAVGFGIRDAAGALAMAECADAVVIGSALVETLQGSRDADEACSRATRFLCPIRKALDAGEHP